MPAPAACRYCGTALDVLTRQRRLTVCGAAGCRQRDDAQRTATWRATVAQASRQAAAAQHPAFPAPTAVVWLRDAPGPLVDVQAAERDAHQAHLLAAVRDGTHVDPRLRGGWSDVTTQSPQGAQLCRQCGGGCCVHGLAGHAFLDSALLQRWVAARPGSSTDDAINFYMRSVPVRHVAHACLYQGDAGCVLDRADRADICNGYACEALRQVQQLTAESPLASAVAVTVRWGAVQDSVLLTPDGAQPLHGA